MMNEFLKRMAASGTDFDLDVSFTRGEGWKLSINDTGSSMGFSAEGIGQALDDAVARLEENMG